VFRSNRHIYAMVVDDTQGITLVQASTRSPELTESLEGGLVKKAKVVGKELARLCAEKGIEKVVFDRNGFIYRKGGKIDSLAGGAREGGLQF